MSIDENSQPEKRPMTVDEAIRLLEKCPPEARIFFGIFTENEDHTKIVRLIEKRFCSDSDIPEVWLHDSQPAWKDVGVDVLSENETFAETFYVDDTEN